MSNFLVAGTSPDDYTEEDSIPILDCPTCGEAVREDKALRSSGSEMLFCSRFCANREEEQRAILVKPEPVGVLVDGWQI